MVAVLTSDMSISYSKTRLRLTNWNTAPNQPLTSLEEIKVQYKDIFKGIGTFPGKPYHINMDPNVPPQHLPYRPVPVHQQDKFKKHLSEMLDAGIIAEVHDATPWINSFVIVETMKDGQRKLQICLDPKPLNKAIMCEPYITHTHPMMSTTSWQMPNT